MSYFLDQISLQSEINRVLDGFDDDPRSAGPNSGRRWAPPTDVVELADGLVVRLDVPGVTREDLEVVLDGDSLIVSGERSVPHPEAGESCRRSERPTGRFARSLTLPADARLADVRADLRDGVLEIRVPTTRALGPRQVAISGGDEGAAPVPVKAPPRSGAAGADPSAEPRPKRVEPQPEQVGVGAIRPRPAMFATDGLPGQILPMPPPTPADRSLVATSPAPASRGRRQRRQPQDGGPTAAPRARSASKPPTKGAPADRSEAEPGRTRSRDGAR